MKTLLTICCLGAFCTLLFFTACETDLPDPDDMEMEEMEDSQDTIFITIEGVRVNNGDVSDITQTSATITGVFQALAPNTFPITDHGHVWSSSLNLPTIENADGATELGIRSSNGPFVSYLTDLEPGTQYHYRTYFFSDDQKAYHTYSASFTTLEASKPVIALSLEEVDKTYFNVKGEIISDGGYDITNHGIVWSTSNPEPTIGNNTGIIENGDGQEGEFFHEINNLNTSTTYFVRIFAENELGISYTETISVETLPWYEVPNGLLAYYTFDEQDASDELGNFHGELWGPEFSTNVINGTSGYSCQFNAPEEDYILFTQGPLTDGLTTFSIAFWLRTVNPTNGIYHCNTPSEHTNSEFRIVDNYWESYTNHWETIDYNMSNYLEGNWHHFVFTVDSDLQKQKLFVDGSFKGEVDFGGKILAATTGVLGLVKYSTSNSGYYYLDGNLDNVRFYNRALNDDEVSTLFNVKQ